MWGAKKGILGCCCIKSFVRISQLDGQFLHNSGSRLNTAFLVPCNR